MDILDLDWSSTDRDRAAFVMFTLPGNRGIVLMQRGEGGKSFFIDHYKLSGRDTSNWKDVDALTAQCVLDELSK